MCRFVSFSLSLILVLFSGSTLAQTSYRWINPKTGETMITDTPPPRNAKLLNRWQSGEQDPNAGLSYAARRAMQDFPVTLYTSSNCVAECKEARDLLNKRGIPFTEKDLKTKEDIDELKALLGDSLGLPALKVGNQTSKGFSADDYNKLLDLAGYPKTAPYSTKPAAEPAK